MDNQFQVLDAKRCGEYIKDLKPIQILMQLYLHYKRKLCHEVREMSSLFLQNVKR